jgi:hypothetical protein|uniref:Complex III subunit 9 n=1 Tax=Fagus sylvatica TaxID=28930 RepID=A0A2N9H852_FAGSY
MESAARRTNGGGLFEGLYKVLMRRNSIYVTFVVAGAYFGERVRLRFLSFVSIIFCLVAEKSEEKTRKMIL